MRNFLVLAGFLMLTACSTNPNTAHSYGNDALPSALSEAAQRADARLHYDNAQIEYDGQGCAVYQGTAANGQVQQVPLTDASGNRICLGKQKAGTQTIDNGGLPSAQ